MVAKRCGNVKDSRTITLALKENPHSEPKLQGVGNGDKASLPVTHRGKLVTSYVLLRSFPEASSGFSLRSKQCV